MKSTTKKVQTIVFISPDIPDLQTIIAGLVPDVVSVILEANGKEIEQMTQALSQDKYSFVHIISHGVPGGIQLGTTTLNLQTINQYSQSLKQWQNLLATHANILLYGCEVAAGDEGSTFIEYLHRLTKAGVAASKTLTGNAEEGGSWEIEQIIPNVPTIYPSPHLPNNADSYAGRRHRPEGMPSSNISNLVYHWFVSLFNALKGNNQTKHQSFLSGILALLPVHQIFDALRSWIAPRLEERKPHLEPTLLPNLVLTPEAQLAYSGVLALSFAPKQDFVTSNFPAPGSNPYAVATADFNADGNVDLAVDNTNSNDVGILINTTPAQDSRFTFNLQGGNTVGGTPTSIATADFNGDSLPDIAVATDVVSVLVNTTATSAANASFAPKQDIDLVSSPYSIGVADINGDGRPDIVTANYLDRNISVLINTTTTGATQLSFANPKEIITGVPVESVTTGDYNDDGKPDIAVANTESNNFSVLLNSTPNGATQAQFVGSVVYTSPATAAAVSSGDFNRDGKPDLAVTDLRLGTDTSPTAIPFPGVSLLVNNTLSGSGNPNFADAGFSPTGAVSKFLASGDFNGDGFVEPVTDGGNGNVSIFENLIPLQGPNVFARNLDFQVGTGASSAAVGDFNRDGKIDLAVTNSASVSVLLNTSPGAPPVQPTQFFGTEIDDVLDGTFGNDTINGLGGNDALDGLSGSDFIFGDRGTDQIFGGDGDDTLDGGADNDIMFGQRDRDLMDGDKGNDTLYGGKGNDTMYGDRVFDLSGGFDLIYGNNNDDQLFGGAGDDTINGGKENDLVNGQLGNDILSGDLGLDSLVGEAGQDIFVLRAGAGLDTIVDFKPGEDLLGLGGNLAFSQLSFIQDKQDTFIIAGGQSIAKLNGINSGQLTAKNFYPIA